MKKRKIKILKKKKSGKKDFGKDWTKNFWKNMKLDSEERKNCKKIKLIFFFEGHEGKNWNRSGFWNISFFCVLWILLAGSRRIIAMHLSQWYGSQSILCWSEQKTCFWRLDKNFEDAIKTNVGGNTWLLVQNGSAWPQHRPGPVCPWPCRPQNFSSSETIFP